MQAGIVIKFLLGGSFQFQKITGWTTAFMIAVKLKSWKIRFTMQEVKV